MALSQEKFVALWQKRITKGRTHYIIKFALLWGIGMIIFMSLFNVIFDGNFTIEALTSEFTAKEIYIKLIIFPIAGGILGYINWNNGVKRYNQITNEKNTEND